MKNKIRNSSVAVRFGLFIFALTALANLIPLSFGRPLVAVASSTYDEWQSQLKDAMFRSAPLTTPVSQSGSTSSAYDKWQSQLKDAMFRSAPLTTPVSQSGAAQGGEAITPDLEIVSSVGESYFVKYSEVPSSSGFIAMTSPSNLALPPVAKGAGDVSSAESSWLVVTDSKTGYTIQMRSATKPAMTSTSGSFADYVGGSGPVFIWAVGPKESAFGFSVSGEDTSSAFKNNGSSCGGGAFVTNDRCWDGLTTSYKTIARGSSPNFPNGTITTVRFRAQSGSEYTQPKGRYRAVIYVTALAL